MRKPHFISALTGAAVLGLSALPTVAVAQTPMLTTAATTGSVSTHHLLHLLTVSKESHTSTYARSKFRLWIDANHDGENTRAEVLKAESTKKVTENSHHTVVTGRWVSPYDGVVVTRASKLDIDHLVPLEEAWTSGAYAWSATRRTAYANDTGYSGGLVAVTAHANRSKGDKEPGQYLPPKRSDDCTYVKQYIVVKYRWKLAVDPGEKADLARELKTSCGSHLAVPRPSRPSATAVRKLAGVGGSTSVGGGTHSSGTDPRYATCTAEAAGAHTPRTTAERTRSTPGTTTATATGSSANSGVPGHRAFRPA